MSCEKELYKGKDEGWEQAYSFALNYGDWFYVNATLCHGNMLTAFLKNDLRHGQSPEYLQFSAW